MTGRAVWDTGPTNPAAAARLVAACEDQSRALARAAARRARRRQNRPLARLAGLATATNLVTDIADGSV